MCWEAVKEKWCVSHSSFFSLNIQKCFLFWLSEEQELSWSNEVDKEITALFLQHALDSAVLTDI